MLPGEPSEWIGLPSLRIMVLLFPLRVPLQPPRQRAAHVVEPGIAAPHRYTIDNHGRDTTGLQCVRHLHPVTLSVHAGQLTGARLVQSVLRGKRMISINSIAFIDDQLMPRTPGVT
jgi:hypothetical protein